MRKAGLLSRARAVLIRRGTDPWESHRGGLINTLLPESKVPSHQGPDARTVIPDLDVVTMAAAGPFNLAHTHFTVVEAPGGDRGGGRPGGPAPGAADRVRPRVERRGGCQLGDRDRPRSRPTRADLWEVALWEDTLAVSGKEIFLSYVVHNEAIVTPENVDAIRAVTAIETDGAKSTAETDQSLGIRRELP